VNAPDLHPLQRWLQSTSAGALDADSRRVLAKAAQEADADAEAPDSMTVLVDTLDGLVRLSAESDVLAAALLFGAPALQVASGELLKAHPGVPGLLEGQAAAAQVWSLHAEAGARGNSEGLRRLLLSIVRDLRVVPILLARQLARMRAAANLPGDERRRLATLTRDIHAPLANRLGIWQLKWELEDLAFRHLEPQVYKDLAQQLDEKRSGRERFIESVKGDLHAALATHGIDAEISGRPKHIYSIWRKMQKKQVPMDELYDLRAVRVAVGDVAACYAALGVVHALWLPIPSEFDDYIARPKPNDYRSLHTAVIGPEGRTLEVQIRTHEMHAQAELGVAAHWRYKEGKGGDRAFDRKIAWMRRLLEPAPEAAREDGQPALADALGAELAEERIYTLTPKGEVIDLPRGGTVLDFAYHVHTMVGHRTRGAKVNGRIVPLGHVLSSGDRVEILVGKTGEPRRDWLLPANGFLASGRSRDKVRAWFHKLDRARNVQAGREVLERELKRLGLQHADLAPVARKNFHADSVEDLYIQVALGDVGPSQVGRALHEEQRAANEPVAPQLPRRPVKGAAPAAKSKFTVQGVGNLLVQLARCCQPVAGEPITGYLTRGRGVTVHRTRCAALQRLAAAHPQRVLPVEWGVAGGGYEVDVQILALDRKWLLKDVTTLIAQEDAHVIDIRSDNVRDSGRAQLRLRLKVSDYGQLSTLLGKLDALPGVEQARRSG
jgi:GTP pyrophosphokinase